MREKIAEKKLVIYEVIPPKGTEIDRCMRLCRSVLEAGVDLIAITDMPVGSARMAPWAVAKSLLDEGSDVLVHFTRTSRNVLRLESDLLGMHHLGIRNVLLLSGDDPKIGDYPNATRVEDLDMEGLIKLVKLMNEGRDLAGNELKGGTDFFVGAVFNPLSIRDLERARGKVSSGVDFLVSQPVFRRDVNLDLGVPVIASVVFFKSEKQMRYFSSVPGIEIPERFFEDVDGKGNEYILDYTFDRTLEIIEEIWDRVSGFYIPGIVRSVERVRGIVEHVEDLSKRSG